MGSFGSPNRVCGDSRCVSCFSPLLTLSFLFPSSLLPLTTPHSFDSACLLFVKHENGHCQLSFPFLYIRFDFGPCRYSWTVVCYQNSSTGGFASTYPSDHCPHGEWVSIVPISRLTSLKINEQTNLANDENYPLANLDLENDSVNSCLAILFSHFSP